MKRTAISIVQDALARVGAFGMDAEDAKPQKSCTVEQTSDDEVTYKFRVHVNKKKFKPVSKELAEQTGVAGNGGDGKDGGDEPEEEGGDGGGSAKAQDEAVAMDSPSAAVNAARRECAASIEQCRARNKFACPYHGAIAIKADLIDRLTQAGVNTVPTVESDLDRRGKPTGTFSISIPCVNTPEQRRLVEGAIDGFLRSPGIDPESIGEGARNDYEEEDAQYISYFDVDALNPTARREEDAHEEREEEPQQGNAREGMTLENAAIENVRQALSGTRYENQELEVHRHNPNSIARIGGDADFLVSIDGRNGTTLDVTFNQDGTIYRFEVNDPIEGNDGRFENVNEAITRFDERTGNSPAEQEQEPEQAPETPAEAERETPPAEEPEIEEQPQAEEGWGTFEDANGNPIRMRTDWDSNFLLNTLDPSRANTRDFELAGREFGVQVDFEGMPVRDFTRLMHGILDVETDDSEGNPREEVCKIIAKYATPLPQTEPQSAAPAEPPQTQTPTQEPQQTETPATQTQGEQPQAESTQTPRQQPTTPIPSTPFSDMATEAFTRAKNAAFSAGPDDRVAQARGRALSSVLGRANGIAGGHTMAEIHDRLHNMMGEAVMRNDRESVQGYQQALDMIGAEGGFTPRAFDPRSVTPPAVDFDSIEHGEGESISQSELDAVRNLAKAANLAAYIDGGTDSSRSEAVAKAHAYSHLLSRNGGFGTNGGINTEQYLGRASNRLYEKAGDPTAYAGTMAAHNEILRALGRRVNDANMGMLNRLSDRVAQSETPASATQQPAPQSTTQTTERRPTAAQPQSAEPPRQAEPQTATATPTPTPAPAATPQPTAAPRQATPTPTESTMPQPQPAQAAPGPATTSAATAAPAPRRAMNNRRASAIARSLGNRLNGGGLSNRTRSIIERMRQNAERMAAAQNG